MRGYYSETRYQRAVSEDMELLYYSIAARCAQIVILSRYDALSDPDNEEYLLADNLDTLNVLRNFYQSYNKQDFLNTQL